VQNDGRIFLTYSNRLYVDNRWFSSTNLSSWTNLSLGIEVAPPISNSVEVLTDSVQKFFRIAQVRYASTTFAPKNVLGRTLTMVFFGGIGTNTIVFNSTNGGTYSFPGVSSGTVKSYSWTQDPYRGSLWPIKYSILNDMTLLFDFTSNTNGVFSGTVYNVPPFGVSGTFTLLGP
jgi:hypothetical protein